MTEVKPLFCATSIIATTSTFFDFVAGPVSTIVYDS